MTTAKKVTTTTPLPLIVMMMRVSQKVALNHLKKEYGTVWDKSIHKTGIISTMPYYRSLSVDMQGYKKGNLFIMVTTIIRILTYF